NMGKNISGAGMDTNIIGRRMQTGESEFTTPSVRRIMVCNLTEASDGNAVGIGFADFTTKRLVDRLIPENTWVNCITGLGPQKGRIPIYFDTDERVIEAAFDTIGMIEPDAARVVRINSTLHLDEVLISESMQAAVDGREDLVLLGEPFEIPFDDSGQMLSFEETIKAGKH
ncbi:MAG: [Fe-S]-binding protein, partial [Lentisphaeria bacterium]|nr:[Fe-S]-binding protein [Lentisphaeria bacterium]